ncbi:MAG: glycoside hydrolase family 127 protein, partial [Armatimonadetes bacterium]|nr:glycoside hydrolase family 127 protein [Armatimonadota bacterium]
DEQSEREHNLQGERTSSGDFGGRRWRHAVEGGWFSYDLKVDPEHPMELVVTYWGDDGGIRFFDIVVDDKVIATQRLRRDKPGRFFDVVYPIPPELTKGKTKVTVRFQAHPKAIAGGIFGLRMVKAKPTEGRDR